MSKLLFTVHHNDFYRNGDVCRGPFSKRVHYRWDFRDGRVVMKELGYQPWKVASEPVQVAYQAYLSKLVLE
jgi:hypothetical protein